MNKKRPLELSGFKIELMFGEARSGIPLGQPILVGFNYESSH